MPCPLPEDMEAILTNVKFRMEHEGDLQALKLIDWLDEQRKVFKYNFEQSQDCIIELERQVNGGCH